MTVLTITNLATPNLGGINLTLSPSECLTIGGESGSGKTLLLRAIADLDAHQGTVLLDDIPCEKMAAPQWRRHVAMLPANPLWWHDTVGEHFDAVNEDQLKALGFDKTVLDWQVDRLSSGEQQRLALARLLSRNPEVLLLDEPTANLDTINANKVEVLVEKYRLSRGAAVIWVSHDPQQQQRVATRHYTIEHGELKLQTPQ